MEMQVEDLGEVAKVCLIGRLDSPGVDRVETRFLASLVPAGKNAIVDLGQVSFVSSMGIRMLLSAAKSMRGRQARLILFGLQPRVKQVFDAVALTQIVPVRKSEDEAVATANAGA